MPAKTANTDVNTMILTVFDNGNATLQVTFNNRQAISYNGNVKALKAEKILRIKSLNIPLGEEKECRNVKLYSCIQADLKFFSM